MLAVQTVVYLSSHTSYRHSYLSKFFVGRVQSTMRGNVLDAEHFIRVWSEKIKRWKKVRVVRNILQQVSFLTQGAARFARKEIFLQKVVV